VVVVVDVDLDWGRGQASRSRLAEQGGMWRWSELLISSPAQCYVNIHFTPPGQGSSKWTSGGWNSRAGNISPYSIPLHGM
jgi:hypothetical protein